MSDIVGQMANEMHLTGDMLNTLQQQQMMGGGMPGMQPGMVGGQDFSHLSPEQQMAMMDSFNRQAARRSAPIPDDLSSEISSRSSSSDGSVSMADSIVSYLKAPIIVMVIFILFSLAQFDSILKPLLPLLLSGGMYYIALKGACAGLAFLLVRLVVN